MSQPPCCCQPCCLFKRLKLGAPGNRNRRSHSCKGMERLHVGYTQNIQTQLGMFLLQDSLRICSPSRKHGKMSMQHCLRASTKLMLSGNTGNTPSPQITWISWSKNTFNIYQRMFRMFDGSTLVQRGLCDSVTRHQKRGK